jgi:hypothetical protein
MTMSVGRLQNLLETVQRNRRAPRASAPPASAPATRSYPSAPDAPGALDPEILAQDEFPLEPERGSVPISLDAHDVPPPEVEVPRAAAVPYEARRSGAYEEPAGFGTVAEEPSYGGHDARGANVEDPFAPVDVDTGTDAQAEEPAFDAGDEDYSNLAPAEGAVVTAPPVAQPSRAIAQVVSRHPPAELPTFGKLLSRSLSLRAR